MAEDTVQVAGDPLSFKRSALTASAVVRASAIASARRAWSCCSFMASEKPITMPKAAKATAKVTGRGPGRQPSEPDGDDGCCGLAPREQHGGRRARVPAQVTKGAPVTGRLQGQRHGRRGRDPG